MRSIVVISTISLVIALLLGEGCLRLTGHSPRAAWINPHFDGSNWGLEDPQFGWVNRLGTFRSIEEGKDAMSFWEDHSRVSRPDKNRRSSKNIVLVGCSFTQGYGVTDSETYAYRINERFADVTVDNYGTGGYSAYQSFLRMHSELERRKAAPPSAVIYGFIPHQMLRTVAASEWIYSLSDSRGNFLIPPHVTLDGGGNLVEHPMEVIPPWPLEYRSALVTLLHKVSLEARYGDRASQALLATENVLRRMAELAKSHGVPFLVVLLNSEYAPGGLETYEKFVRFLDQAEISHLNCVVPSDRSRPHPSGVVHQHWADCIGTWIEDNLEVAPRSGRRSPSNSQLLPVHRTSN